jgi:hypothetical protein
LTGPDDVNMSSSRVQHSREYDGGRDRCLFTSNWLSVPYSARFQAEPANASGVLAV